MSEWHKKYTQVFMYRTVIMIIALHHWLGLRFCLCNKSMVSSMDAEMIDLCIS